jgi:hypothetical protein
MSSLSPRSREVIRPASLRVTIQSFVRLSLPQPTQYPVYASASRLVEDWHSRNTNALALKYRSIPKCYIVARIDRVEIGAVNTTILAIPTSNRVVDFVLAQYESK